MKDGHFLAIDSKVSFDDNALIWHPDVVKLRDSGEEDPREVEASTYNLNYVCLDGNIACLVNGAGLGMATMDRIMYSGSEPANFLDIGGGANEEQVIHPFEFFEKPKYSGNTC
jgi:succinyl-CoA synthetase beta subunit